MLYFLLGLIIGTALGFVISAWAGSPAPKCDEPATDRQRAYLARLQREHPEIKSEVDPHDPELTMSRASLAIDYIKREEEKGLVQWTDVSGEED